MSTVQVTLFNAKDELLGQEIFDTFKMLVSLICVDVATYGRWGTAAGKTYVYGTKRVDKKLFVWLHLKQRAFILSS